MLNYDKSGATWTGATKEDVVSGQAVMLGYQIGIAQFDALDGEICVFSLEGMWLVVTDGNSIVPGTPINWSVTNKNFYGGLPGNIGDFLGVGISASYVDRSDNKVLSKINTHFSTLN